MRTLIRRSLTLAVCLTLATTPVAPPQAQALPELPSLGEVAADDLSPANERKLGEAIMQQAYRDPTYLPDADAIEYLNNLGYQLVSASPARYMDFNFFLVRDPTLNAFALPGGFIGVHTGLVLAAQSESELAAVMAHEIGHVEQRHIARMLAKQKDSTAIAIGALLLALLAARSNSSSSGDLTQAAVLGGQAAAVQQQLNFSREAEREADRVGLQTLIKAGFDPRGMAQFFGRLQQASRVYESSAAPAYLRTHPLSVERMSDMQNRISESRVRQRIDSLDFNLVRARLRVLQDPSVQGARDALQYFDSQLRDRTTPSEAASQYGVALAALRLNQPQRAYAAAQASRRAARQQISPMLDKLVSEARHAAAATPVERAAAVADARDAAQRFPLSRLSAIHVVQLLHLDNRSEEAVAYLREQLALPRSDTTYFSLLSKSYGELGKRTLQHQATAEAYQLMGATPAAIEQLQLARKAADADFYVLSEVDARLRQLTQQYKEQREEMARNMRRPPPEDEGRKKGR
ncbi:MAG: M48 family metallopeptidase [Betaproteobacteria bacterium]